VILVGSTKHNDKLDEKFILSEVEGNPLASAILRNKRKMPYIALASGLRSRFGGVGK